MSLTTVTVYSFLLYEDDPEFPRHSAFKTTRERIEQHFGAVVLEGTREEVPASELDPDGHYARQPTGWASL
jgi:hypothetical protein